MALYYLANVNNKYMQNMLMLQNMVYYLANVNNKYMQNNYLANVDNKYVQNTACIIWLMSIINIFRKRLVLSG